MTLRTFHVGGVADISEENRLVAKFDGIAEIEDLKTVKGEDAEGNEANIVISRTTELKLVDSKTKNVLNTHNIPMDLLSSLRKDLKSKKAMSFVSGIPLMV